MSLLIRDFRRRTLPSALAAGASGSVFVAWGDNRNGSADIYAQKLTAAGTKDWNAGGPMDVGGTRVNFRSGNIQYPKVVPDNSGGAVFTWFKLGVGFFHGLFTKARFVREPALAAKRWIGFGRHCLQCGEHPRPDWVLF